ncbi:MAG: glycosyltransferase [Dehalococcoidia bacterium]
MAEKMAVVGLPVNTHRLDAFYTEEKFSRPTIVFNHALIPSKAPEVFLDVAERILAKQEVDIVITRGVEDEALNTSTDELLDKIDYYLKNEKARRKVAAELRERSLRYTPEQVSSRLAALFSELVI